MTDRIPFIPENAPFRPEQRLWLNGYLAGLFSSASAPTAPQAPESKASLPLLILYGSQTGTAEGLARRVAKAAKARGCEPRVVDAAAHATIPWEKESHLLVVTSTYGDGEMPDNAQGFWEWLQGGASAALAKLDYAVLALGDTNYPEFCAAGKKIDERLQALGARRLFPRTDCDVDYENAAQAWIEGALAALTKAEAVPSAEPVVEAPALPASVGYSKTNPFPARLLTNRKLNGPDSAKETRHFEIALEGSGLVYEAGDALGIYPRNDPVQVAEILKALGCTGEEEVPAPGGASLPLRQVLLEQYDLAKPSAEFLQRIAPRHPVLSALLAPEQKEELKKWLWGREIIDLLLEAPQAKFSPAEFIGLLKKLAPRLYSISSSPKAHAGEVHLTVGIVRYEAHGRKRQGVCSTFLADRAEAVPVFIQTSHGFRPPQDGNLPIIMVGPGTGIAPFRAFLHERRAGGAKGKNWLLFGDQRAEADFYYREELEAMRGDGHLTRLTTAFSRDQAEKIYVQHRMMEEAAELWKWLEEGAHFYVCGDASRMAKDVDAALHSVIESAGGLSREAAAEYVKKLKADKRYQRDVY